MPEQNSAAQPRAPVRTSALVVCVGAACAAICAPLVSRFESSGKPQLVAYHGALDPPGIYSICDGDTLNVHKGTAAKGMSRSCCSERLKVVLDP